jgi:multidrug efflux system outer membrane protein
VSVSKSLFTGVAAALLTASCSVGPNYAPPVPATPDAWELELRDGLFEGSASIHDWWGTFDDPTISILIGRAAANNKTLLQAVARIDEFRATLGVARGDFYPDLDASGAATRMRTSEDFTSPTGHRQDTVGGVGLDASWEIDVFGRIRRSVESASAGYEASVEDYRDVLVILFADVASTYVDVRAFQERLRLAKENVRTQSSTLQLTKGRNRAGLVGELDVRQAELNLATTESFIPQLRIFLAASVHRLGVLVGDGPDALRSMLSDPSPIPAPRELAGLGVPADLVRQRPDVRSAERELAAQSARIGVATSDLYPRFSFTGAFAFEGTDDILTSRKRAWDFGPSVRWNIFDFGRVRGRIDAEDARTRQALYGYESTVLNALQDAENSMVAYSQERLRVESLGRAALAAQQSVELVGTQYKAGLTDFQNVLDTQRSLFEQQDTLAQSVGDVAKNLISVYRAFGGGWTRSDLQQASIKAVEDAINQKPEN